MINPVETDNYLYIVNLHRINMIERNRIIFDNNVYIPVSEQYKDAFQQFIANDFL